MNGNGKVLLKVAVPWWFRALISVGALPISVYLMIIVINLTRDGLTLLELVAGVLLLLFAYLFTWALFIVWSTWVATESALEHLKPFRRSQKFAWSDIVRVSRPRFGIPADATYVFSRRGEKITLLRSIPGYTKLLDIIEARAPHVSPARLPRNLWPSRSSWNNIWVALGFVLLYVLLRYVVFR